MAQNAKRTQNATAATAATAAMAAMAALGLRPDEAANATAKRLSGSMKANRCLRMPLCRYRVAGITGIAGEDRQRRMAHLVRGARKEIILAIYLPLLSA